jgi:hypothetical protein
MCYPITVRDLKYATLILGEKNGVKLINQITNELDPIHLDKHNNFPVYIVSDRTWLNNVTVISKVSDKISDYMEYVYSVQCCTSVIIFDNPDTAQQKELYEYSKYSHKKGVFIIVLSKK